jgi:hypothetical protein
MSKPLSAGQIAGLIKYYSDPTSNGSFHTPITADNAVKAVAICLAESGGTMKRSDKPNSNGTYDWGAWQINDIHKPSDEVKNHWAPNWQTAYQIASGGTNWKPWSTYNNGRYVQFMGAAAAAWQTAKPINGHEADQAAGIDPNEEGTTNKGETITTLSGPLAFLNVFINPNTWVRVAMVVAGTLLIMIFIVSIIRKQAVGAVAKQIGKNITPSAKPPLSLSDLKTPAPAKPTGRYYNTAKPRTNVRTPYKSWKSGKTLKVTDVSGRPIIHE